ncbi:MAG: Glu/Leu/Phe/Val dehydrogenase [Gammaproteobacteria bacterium]|nr:MAG: Glu/Leu/Phe/Val dehydrogenase [Gammaproteobacteria bacterium]UTW41607.1 Glu/Leu/Phe/Val dehydrogenase [bacterium SCSIO 12844]
MDTMDMTNITEITNDTDYLTEFQGQVIHNLEAFTQKEPEIKFTWKDSHSDTRGFLVINSLKGNACGGGTRVHENVSVNEVTTLAKIMEIKFAFSGPEIGGAKTGIQLDPTHPQKYEILERWYQAIKPILKNCYGTGSDLNTDIHKINETLKPMGIENSQEGIIYAVTKGDEAKKSQAINNMKLLAQSVQLTSELSVQLAELVTGYGVFASIDSFLTIAKDSLQDKKVFIQGVGNVGAAALWYLYNAGAKIVALSDHNGGLLFDNGISKEQLISVIKNRSLSHLGIELYNHDEFNQQFINTTVDVFVPAAGSNLINKSFIDQLYDNGLSLIACGANHPFVENEYCYGVCSQYLDRKLTVIPDFLANMGMARTFYHLMSEQSDHNLTTENVFKDIYQEIHQNIEQAYAINNGKLMTASLYKMALDRIS